jgi:hypothetical protein
LVSYLGAIPFSKRQRRTSFARQVRSTRQWRCHLDYLEKFLAKPNYAEEAQQLDIPARLEAARRENARVNSPAYLAELRGTLGAEPAIVAAKR